MKAKRMSLDTFRPPSMTLLVLLIGGAAIVLACAAPVKHSVVKNQTGTYSAGAILSSATGKAVDFEQMLADLAAAKVVYVGETHRSRPHHAVQLRVIESLHQAHGSISVGMEMFDRSYQHVLDRWSRGELTMEEFLRRTHWYANWRFDHLLYAPILQYISANRIPLLALNLPFHLPSKIRVGGIEYLSENEKAYLPDDIDTSFTAHREYAQAVFNRHNFGANTRFEDFYLAQCVWEDGMAAAIADHSAYRPMVVIAGNGHIQYKYGIPERAYRRTGETFRTVYPVTAGDPIDLAIADYIWITE
jgi:uncharacterized iron-regulated protein